MHENTTWHFSTSVHAKVPIFLVLNEVKSHQLDIMYLINVCIIIVLYYFNFLLHYLPLITKRCWLLSVINKNCNKKTILNELSSRHSLLLLSFNKTKTILK